MWWEKQHVVIMVRRLVCMIMKKVHQIGNILVGVPMTLNLRMVLCQNLHQLHGIMGHIAAGCRRKCPDHQCDDQKPSNKDCAMFAHLALSGTHHARLGLS